MNFIQKKAISRRTVLRGMGGTVALLLLDAMVPAATATEKTAAKQTRAMFSMEDFLCVCSTVSAQAGGGGRQSCAASGVAASFKPTSRFVIRAARGK